MTNKEFLQTLLVYGKISKRDLVSDIDLERFLITDRFLGNIYLKIGKLPEIKHYEIMGILSKLVLAYELTDKEIDVMVGNFDIIKRCTEVEYYEHIAQLKKQLDNVRNRRNMLEELYKCEVGIRYFGKDVFFPKIYLNDKKYFFFKQLRSIKLLDAINKDTVVDGIKFIGFDDGNIKFITKSEYGIDVLEYYKYRYKLYVVTIH